MKTKFPGMRTYIGTKISEAKPLNRQDYNNFKGWTLPADEDGSDAGYIVQYADGYISWSPAKQFEEAYRLTSGMTFGLATEAAKKGLKVARFGWNGVSMFAYIVKEGVYQAKSNAIRGVFKDDLVPYRAYWALKTTSDDVATWAPSGSDTLADDWYIVE